MLRLFLFSILLFLSSDLVFASNTASNVYTASTNKYLKKDKHPPEQMVRRAHELLGTKYRWGGSSVTTGFDCSGLLVYLHRSIAGVSIPRTTTSMLKSAAPNIPKHKLKPGDAVFFKHNGQRGINHVGLYIGNGRFIHAPSTGKHIRIDSMKNKYWSKSYVLAKRFLPH